MLPELRRKMRLMADRATEGGFVLEATSPSDQLSFRAQEDRTHFLWVYTELFIRLGVRLPFIEFQREVLSWCRVAASQLHLNGWGFLRTFEQSIQEFKWHYFKVLPLPGKRPFWLDDEGTPFPWVYWNAEVGDHCITALDPLETLAFEFLQSLPVGLGKKSNFKCRWILDDSGADVRVFLDSLLKDMEKQSNFDHLMQKMKKDEGAGPRSILPSSKAQTAASGATAAIPVAPASTPAASVPPAPSSGAVKARKKPSKRQKRKVSEASAEKASLGVDSVWEHGVNPIDRVFPVDYNFRAALDAGLTNGPIREILGSLIGVENAFSAKVQMEKELAATRDQVDVLTAKRDSTLAAPLLNAKIKSLSQEPELAEGEHLSALDRMKEVEERAKVQVAELESCCSALEQERKKVESLAQSLKGKQTALSEAKATAVHWRDE
ncbi:hypothetical protein PIB30_038057 [Stylosanthes scabra]|uniref:Aminotransferase-like plant mobile domain-containing protein n=1 Tax=Stylosanthes scabra TaxID=79078 RepID=A0ABU6WFZ0_9FABA|nr:hypothetical protein [Stylosanthes scabra]